MIIVYSIITLYAYFWKADETSKNYKSEKDEPVRAIKTLADDFPHNLWMVDADEYLHYSQNLHYSQFQHIWW